MAFKFLGQRQLGKLPSRWVSTILMVAIDPPEAPCQANRKEGAGATGHLTRLLGAIPQQGQPPNQASSNHTLRLRLSPKQKNRAQAVQAA